MIEARASATALARMAIAVGVTPEQLADVGRGDAADEQRRIAAATEQASAVSTAGSGIDEIELIDASTTMSARQKLHLIRKVLQLRAQAEREETPTQPEAPTSNAGTSHEQ